MIAMTAIQIALISAYKTKVFTLLLLSSCIYRYSCRYLCRQFVLVFGTARIGREKGKRKKEKGKKHTFPL